MDPSRCRLVVAPGAGSTCDFVLRAFPSDVVGVVDAVCVAGDGTTATYQRGFAEAVANSPDPVLLAGVSLGAHAAASFLAANPPGVSAVILALPAWTGPPNGAADLTCMAGEHMATAGPNQVLQSLPGDDWVTHELARAWATIPKEELITELQQAGLQAGPTVAELSRIDIPVVILSLADDPFHPVAVATEWAEAIPNAIHKTIPRSAPAADRSLFGQVAARALATLQ